MQRAVRTQRTKKQRLDVSVFMRSHSRTFIPYLISCITCLSQRAKKQRLDASIPVSPNLLLQKLLHTDAARHRAVCNMWSVPLQARQSMVHSCGRRERSKLPVATAPVSLQGQSATSPGVLQPAMSMVPRRRASVPALFGHAGGDFRGCCANESGGAFFLRVSAGACFCRERRRRPRGLRRRGAELRGLQGPKLRHELPRFWNRFETELVLLQAATAQSQEARRGFEGLLGAMLRGSAAQPGQCVLMSPSEWVSIGRPFALQQVRNRCWIRLGSPPPPCDAYHRHLTCSIM